MNRILDLRTVTKAAAVRWHLERIEFCDLMASTPQVGKHFGQLARMRVASMEWLDKNRHVVRPEDLS